MADLNKWRTHFPVIGARKNESGDYITQDIRETVQILDGYARLSQVPKYEPATGTMVKIDGYTEVFVTPSRQTDFLVNYATGRVYFHASQEGAYVNANYAGIGSLVAADEINWMWENLVGKYRSDFFVQLLDTPNMLVPQAYIRADSTGSKLENVAASVGRSYSVATIMRNFTGTGRVKGTLFDPLTLYEITTPVRGTVEYDLTGSNYTGTGAAITDGTWQVSAGYSEAIVATDGRVNTGVYNSVNKLKIKEYTEEGGSIRLLVIIDGEYYTYTNGGWQFRKDTAPTITEVMSYGNLPHELENTNPKHMRFVTGKQIGIYAAMRKSGAVSPKLSPVLLIDGYTGGSYKVTQNWTATFDQQVAEWEITAPAGKDYLLTSGSGGDDVACTCDVAEFSNVPKNSSVIVNAPVRTMVNVLRYIPGANGKIKYPENGPWWSGMTDPEIVPVEKTIYPHVCSGFSPRFHDPTVFLPGKAFGSKDMFCNFAAYPVQNILHETPTDLVSGTRQPTPLGGMLGPAGLFDSKNNAKLVLLNKQDQNTAAVPGKQSAAIAGTVGGWFKNLSGAPIIISNYYNNVYSCLYVLLYPTRVSIQCGGTGYSFPYTEGEWVHIVIKDYSIWRESSDWSPGVCDGRVYGSIIINGVKYSLSGKHTDGGRWDVRVPFNCPSTIGSNYGNIAAGNSFLCEQAIATEDNMPDADIVAMYTAQMAEINAVKNTTRTVFHATVDNFVPSNVGSYDKMYIPEEWATHPREFLFAFYDGSAFYTIHPETREVIGLNQHQDYEQLKYVCATMTTLRESSALLTSGRFDTMKLVVISRDLSGKRMGWAFPAAFDIEVAGMAGKWKLCGPSDAEVRYTDTAWDIKNLGPDSALRVAVMGGTMNDGSAKYITSLLDCPSSLLDYAPKTLVAQDGVVTKKVFLHPYLRGN